MTFEEFVPLINYSCVYCNKNPCRGVDRIDSSKSYTVENTQPCCRICNIMKNDMSKTDFIEHLKNIFNKLGTS
jgi:hypothetical protein